MLKLYNTLTRRKEEFIPLAENKPVGLYTCGPTVYWFAHIGNLRTYIFEDILRRALEYNGFKVKHLMNITDVGHLVSDADTGEDKIEKEARKERKSAWEIAEFYTKTFKKDLKLLNILSPNIWVKATDTIKDQIEFIQKLEKKGFVYKILDGVYFDTSKLKTYGRLWGEKKRKIRPGARVKIVPGKKNPTDFALWKFSTKKTKRQMEWNSPWGIGFPGWHTECIVMAIKILGIPFDIHCGGVDHILIHHTNEIAQAEAVYGKILAKYWLHGEFLSIKKGRMGKSERNIITVNDLIKKGFNPLAYRYFCLGTHYRKRFNFSWKALRSSQSSLNSLYEKVTEIKNSKDRKKINSKNYKDKFLDFINNDLNTSRVLALAWDLIRDKRISNKEKLNLLLAFDTILGLDLGKIKKHKIPLKVKKLVNKREKYRKKDEWEKADEIRKQIEEISWKIEDTKKGPIIKEVFLRKK